MDSFPEIPGYRIKKILGEGGMSIVYLAIQEKLKRKVAVKVMHPHRMKDTHAARRFLKEAETAAKLDHSNIVSIIDFGEAGNVYYLTMEYLPISLAAKIKQSTKGKLAPQEALHILEQVADALDYAHSHGIVHRDIKSENILFRRDGTPVVVDFGIARTINSTTRLTRTGVSIGTIHYMSPEQCRAEELDGRTDLYSLGVVLYEMLTGRLPYDAQNEAGVLLKHLQEKIPPLPEHLAAIEPVILCLLEKNRDKRIARGRDLVRLINDLKTNNRNEDVGSAGLPGSSMPTIEIPYNAFRRKRSVFWKVSLILFSILAISIVLYYTAFQNPNSSVPPIVIPNQDQTSIPSKNSQAHFEEKDDKIRDAEYLTLVNQAKHLIDAGDFKPAADLLNRARQIKDSEEIAGLEKSIAQKQLETKRLAEQEASQKKQEKEYKDNMDLARQKLAEGQFQPALEFVAVARKHRDTEESRILENQIKISEQEVEQKSIIDTSPPQEVKIFAIPSNLQKKYNEILKRVEIPGPPPGTWVSGQVSMSLSVQPTGEIVVTSFLDKWLTIKPDKSRDKIRETIVSRIGGITLLPPTSKNGAPVVVNGWRMNFKVETFQGKIILDLQ